MTEQKIVTQVVRQVVEQIFAKKRVEELVRAVEQSDEIALRRCIDYLTPQDRINIQNHRIGDMCLLMHAYKSGVNRSVMLLLINDLRLNTNVVYYDVEKRYTLLDKLMLAPSRWGFDVIQHVINLATRDTLDLALLTAAKRNLGVILRQIVRTGVVSHQAIESAVKLLENQPSSMVSMGHLRGRTIDVLKRAKGCQPKNASCVVCFESLDWSEMGKDRQPMCLPCGHRFCRGCVQQLPGQPKKCPLCREAVWSAAPWYGRHMHQGNTTPQNCDKCTDNILGNWADDEHLPSSDVQTPHSADLKTNAGSKDAISLNK